MKAIPGKVRLSPPGEHRLRVRTVRHGWAKAAKRIAATGDDRLVLGELASAADADWEWQNPAGESPSGGREAD